MTGQEKVEIVFVDTVGAHQTNGAIRRRVLLRVDGEDRDVQMVRLDSGYVREQLTKRWADLAECEAEVVAAKLRKAALLATAQEQAAARQADGTPGDKPDYLADTSDDVKQAAEALLSSGDLIDRVGQDLEAVGIAGERQTALLVYLIGTSRKLDRPLAGIIQSASASGKSYLLRHVAQMMPPEEVLAAHSITPEVLYYLPEGDLRHKFIVAGERLQSDNNGDAEAATKAFRELVADGELRKLVTIRDEDGNPTARHICQPGPVAYAESTTAGTLFDEDATRLLGLGMDETAGQTEAVQRRLASEAAGDGVHPAKRDWIIEVHRTAQRMLRADVAVLVPFAPKLRLPANKVAVRRAFGHLLSVVQTVAFLRQRQRQILSRGGREYVVAEPADYAIALDLLAPVLAQTFSPLPTKSRELLEVVDQNAGGGDFTRDDLSGWAGISYRETLRRLKPLVGTGLISQDTSAKPYRLRRTDATPPTGADLGLPDPADLQGVCNTSPENPAQCTQTLISKGLDYEARGLPSPAQSPGGAALGNIGQEGCLTINPLSDKDLQPLGENPGESAQHPPVEGAGAMGADLSPGRLRRLADACEDLQPDLATEYRQRAGTLEARQGVAS